MQVLVLTRLLITSRFEIGTDEGTRHSRMRRKLVALRVVRGSVGEALKGRHACTACIPYLERRRISRATLRMLSGSATLASGFNGLVVPAQRLALLGCGA